jgi:hypothetical protein
VDAHNVVPCWVTSDKCEFAAKTIRKKIHNGVDQFLEEFPAMQEHTPNVRSNSATRHSGSSSSVDGETAKEEVEWNVPASVDIASSNSSSSSSSKKTTSSYTTTVTLSSLLADTQWETLLSYLSLNQQESPGLQVKEITWAEPGERGGIAKLREFVSTRLDKFDNTRCLD